MSRTSFSNTLIASPQLALGRVGPFDMSLNGQPIVDAFNYFGAEYATVFEHGDGPVELEYSVTCLFASEADMLLFVATHRESLPRQADHTIVDDDETRALVLADAVRSVTFSQLRGTSCLARYKFTGSRFTSDDVPEDPTDSDPVKAKVITLDPGDVIKGVTFDVPFASAPRICDPKVSGPASADGGIGILAFLVDEPTAEGCTVELSQAVPASGTYKLRVSAML